MSGGSSTNSPTKDGKFQVVNRYANMSPEELMRGCTIPVDLTRIDPQWWDMDVTPRSNNDHLTTYMGEQLKAYQPSDMCDEELLYAFQDQFEGWTEKMFKKVHHTYLREMKKLLRTRGINTGPTNGVTATQFAALLENDHGDMPMYTEGYLTKTVFDRRCDAYKASLNARRNIQTLGKDIEEQPEKTVILQLNLKQYNVTVNERAERQPIPSAIRFAESNRKLEEDLNPRSIDQNKVSRLPTQDLVHPSQYSDTESTLVPEQDFYHGVTPKEYPDLEEQPRVTTPRPYEPNPYQKLPPDELQNEMLDPSIMTHFTENFDNENKYSGELYSVLDDTLMVFFDICWYSQIKPTQFHAVFPRILVGRAQKYYMQNVDRRRDTFRAAYLKIKNHFETQINHLKYHSDWTTMTFNGIRVAPENSNKSPQDVLQILIDKLTICQRALGNEYKGEQQLHTATIRACKGAPELKFALFKPAGKCEALFADLRNSIDTYYDQGTQQMLMDNFGGSYDQFYFDRRYNNIVDRGGYRSRFGQRGGGHAFRRGSREGGNSGCGVFSPHTYNGKGNDRKKVCYVCKEEGCWSYNHTAEEQGKAKTAYVADCRFAGVSTRGFAAFLLDYEGHPAEAEEAGG